MFLQTAFFWPTCEGSGTHLRVVTHSFRSPGLDLRWLGHLSDWSQIFRAGSLVQRDPAQFDHCLEMVNGACTVDLVFRRSDSTQWVCGGLVVSVLDCQSRGSGFKSRPGQKFGSRFLLHVCPLDNSAMMSTLTIHCQWEDETVRERTGHPSSHAETKKMKLLTLLSPPGTLEIGPELLLTPPLKTPFDSSQCSWISWCPGALSFWVAL